MLDQSDNLNYFFACFVISDLYFFEEINLLNPYFISSRHFMLPFIDNVITGT